MPVAIDPDPKAAYERMRPVLAFYVGFFPRYRRVAREAGFAGAVDVVTDAYKHGGMAAAVPMVSDEMVATLTAAGTAQEVRARIAEYRRAGITLPIMMPVATANETAAIIAGIIRVCAE